MKQNCWLRLNQQQAWGARKTLLSPVCLSGMSQGTFWVLAHRMLTANSPWGRASAPWFAQHVQNHFAQWKGTKFFFFIFMFSSRHQNWFPEISAVYNFNSFCIALLFFCTGSFFFLISSVICFGKSNFILLSAAAWDGHNIYKWCHEQVMQIIQMRTSKLLYPAKQSCIVEMPCFTVNLRNVLETLKH